MLYVCSHLIDGAVEEEVLLAVARPAGSPKIVDRMRNSAKTTVKYFLPKDLKKFTITGRTVFFRIRHILPIIKVNKRLLVLHMEQNVPKLEHSVLSQDTFLFVFNLLLINAKATEATIMIIITAKTVTNRVLDDFGRLPSA